MRGLCAGKKVDPDCGGFTCCGVPTETCASAADERPTIAARTHTASTSFRHFAIPPPEKPGQTSSPFTGKNGHEAAVRRRRLFQRDSGADDEQPDAGTSGVSEIRRAGADGVEPHVEAERHV